LPKRRAHRGLGDAQHIAQSSLKCETGGRREIHRLPRRSSGLPSPSRPISHAKPDETALAHPYRRCARKTEHRAAGVPFAGCQARLPNDSPADVSRFVSRASSCCPARRNVKAEQPPYAAAFEYGSDGTRTRDLRRDRCDQSLSAHFIWPPKSVRSSRFGKFGGPVFSPDCTRSFPFCFHE